jgi:hypothetical protein
MQIILIYGYAFSVFYMAFLLFAGLAIIYCYFFGMNQIIFRIIVGGTLQKSSTLINELKKYKFSEVTDKHMNECIICFEVYKLTDEVAELKCSEKHYFHLGCISEWFRMKAVCPICKMSAISTTPAAVTN